MTMEKHQKGVSICERTFSPDADDCVNCKERPCRENKQGDELLTPEEQGRNKMNKGKVEGIASE